ncbi:hypothetical protein B0H13DRAFT_2229247 [Mycena leptocephala]|nr:hypothetical protein B0H13DRAFT_2229247 [Mycena leptocephala]
MLSRLPGYPSAATRKSLSPSQLAATKNAIAADTARITLESLIWEAPQDDKLIRKRALVLAEKVADGLDLQTLVDLSIIYARTNATQARAILAAGLESGPLEVESELLPALTALLSASQGLYALRKTGYCIASFLHVCPKKTLRVFTHSKEFIVALAKAYDSGLSTLAHSYGGLSVSDSRESDEWERIWVETKVSLVDAFHIIVRALLDDMSSSSGTALAVEVDRTFDIIFTLLSLPSSSSQPNPNETPFLDRSLLADYQQTYDLSRTLASSLRHAAEKDARVALLESSLQSINSSSEKEPGALKILLRSSGIAPGVDNLGKGFSKRPDTKGKGKDMPAPTPVAAIEDPELDIKVTQQVVEALLEGTAPSAKELQRLMRRQMTSRAMNDSVLRDRTFIEQMKADILRRAEEISDDEERKMLAYIRDPKLFDRDAQTRRGKAREDLKAQTGWSDEQLEGWRIMLERDPKKDKILQKHEFAGNQNQIAPEASSSTGGPQRGGGRGRGGRGGRGGGRGRGGGGGGDDGTARERAWKDKRGNQNRKRGHDKKMARAGGPS